MDNFISNLIQAADAVFGDDLPFWQEQDLYLKSSISDESLNTRLNKCLNRCYRKLSNCDRDTYEFITYTIEQHNQDYSQSIAELYLDICNIYFYKIAGVDAFNKWQQFYKKCNFTDASSIVMIKTICQYSIPFKNLPYIKDTGCTHRILRLIDYLVATAACLSGEKVKLDEYWQPKVIKSESLNPVNNEKAIKNEIERIFAEYTKDGENFFRKDTDQDKFIQLLTNYFSDNHYNPNNHTFQLKLKKKSALATAIGDICRYYKRTIKNEVKLHELIKCIDDFKNDTDQQIYNALKRS